MATKRRKRATRRVSGRRRRRHSTTVTHVTRRRRKHSVGAIGATHRRKRRKSHGFLGATGTTTTLMGIAEIGLGIGIGAAATHMILRPLEHKISQKVPAAAKFMGAAEIVLGGLMIMKGKKAIIRNIGMGVMAGGVHTVMKQNNLGLHSPAEGGHLGDYTTLNVPISGADDEMSGFYDEGYSRTPVVSGTEMGSIIEGYNGPVRTRTVGSRFAALTRTNTVGSPDMDEEDEMLFRSKGARY